MNKRFLLSGILSIAGSVPREGGDPPANEPTAAELKAQLAAAQGNLTKLQTDYATLNNTHGTVAQRLKDLEDAGKTETQKQADALKAAEKDRDTARETVKQTSTRLEVERLARKLNVVDEDAAFKLLDTAAITFDEAGKPTNIQALLEALVKDKAWLVGAAGPAGGRPANTSRSLPNQTGGTYTQEQLADPVFYQANRADILKAMASGRIAK